MRRFSMVLTYGMRNEIAVRRREKKGAAKEEAWPSMRGRSLSWFHLEAP